MTDAPVVTPPAEGQTQAAPAAPQVDIQAIANAAAEAAGRVADERATKIANEKLQHIARAITGEPQKSTRDQYLEALVDDPGRVLSAQRDLIKREIRAEDAHVETVKRTQLAVVQPFINEYPELQAPIKLKTIEKLADEYENPAAGVSYAQALERACKETVKEYGLKSVSEAHRSGSYSYGLPGGGGVSPGAPKFDESKSSSDFVQAQRARMHSFRNKRTS